jgi:hypothetical protein
VGSKNSMGCLSERWASGNPKPGSRPLILLIPSNSDDTWFGDSIYPTSMLFADKFGDCIALTYLKTYYNAKGHSFCLKRYSY